MPSEVALRMDPGTAPTGMPRLDRRVDRVPRSSVVAALDDDHDVTQRGQEAVADRKAPLLGRHPHRGLGHDDARRGHPLPQPLVPPRIGMVESAGNHADGRRAGATGALVRSTVDTRGQTRHHADARCGEVGPELRGHADPIAGRRTCPHQRHGRGVAEHRRVAEAEQERGSLRVVLQPLGVRRLPGQEHPNAK